MSKKAQQVEINLASVYPEIEAGGFSRCDGSVDFYSRLSALTRPDMTVLDFGAGRGGPLHDAKSLFRRDVSKLQGRVAKIVGVDVDDAVFENPFMDETHKIEPGGNLPFADATFDIVYSDWVLEHVATPKEFEHEVWRVLKPGGWFCARTPNRWGITGLGTNLIPNRLHTVLLSGLQPAREARDVFPTTYLLNTRARLRRYFAPDRWSDHSYFHDPEPAYFLRSKPLIYLANLYAALTPQSMSMNMHIFLRKKG